MFQIAFETESKVQIEFYKSTYYCGNIMNFTWKKFDTKLRHNFLEMLEKATWNVWNNFRLFDNVYRISEYFLAVKAKKWILK